MERWDDRVKEQSSSGDEEAFSAGNVARTLNLFLTSTPSPHASRELLRRSGTNPWHLSQLPTSPRRLLKFCLQSWQLRTLVSYAITILVVSRILR